MKRIGLTGGIGSGKTTIAQAFAVLGVPVYNSDSRAKWLTENDKRIIERLMQIIGPEVFVNGHLNKRLMASVIFADRQKLTEVNQLIHPIVFEDFDRWAKSQESAGAKYVINEAAILIENNAYKRLDELILVCAPTETRIERTMIRDNMSRKQVEERIANQSTDEEKRPFASEIIVTDDRHLVVPQILDIHKRLTA